MNPRPRRTPRSSAVAASFTGSGRGRTAASARLAAALLAALAASGPLFAVTDSWDGSVGALWSVADNWSTNTSAPGAGETATFSGAGNGNTVVDLGAGVTVASIIFDTAVAASHTIGSGGAGAQTLTLGNAGAITVNPTVTANQLFNSSLQLASVDAAAASFTNNGSGTLTFAGGVNANVAVGNGVLTVGGSGNTTVSGAVTKTGAGNQALLKTGAGRLALSGDSVWSGAGAIGYVPATAVGFPLVAREGTLLLNGGTHTVTGEAVIGGVVANGGAGQNAKIQIDAGALNVSTWLSVGRGNGVGGVSSDLELNNSASLTTVNLSAGYNGGNAANLPKGAITLNGSSVLNVTSTATGNGAGVATFVVGEYAGSNFTLTTNDTSTVNRVGGNIGLGNQAQGAVQIGRDGTGTVVMNGGTFNAASTDLGRGVTNASVQNGTLTIKSGATYNNEGDFRMGFAGGNDARATVNIDGGTLNVGSTTPRWLVVGTWDFGQSTINVRSGGNLNLNAGSSLRFNQGNNDGPNQINLEAGGAITLFDTSQSTADQSVLDMMLTNNAGNNTFNLNGGTLTVRRVMATASNGTRVFNFNGGTLRATGGNNGTQTFFNLGTGNARANVRDGGAVIDTNGSDLTIPQPLLHSNITGDAAFDGGLTKTGGGTLTLSGVNTYTGNTTINEGGLTIPLNASLKFIIGASGTNTRVSGAGSFTVNGSLDIDVSGAGTVSGNSWTLVDVDTLTETFGETFGVTGFAQSGAKWVKPANGAFYEFDTSTGLLRVIADPGISYPPPAVQPGASNETQILGTDMLFRVSATGTGNLGYQWYYQTDAGTTPQPIAGAIGATLTVGNVGVSSAGIYSVIVSDDAATASGQAPTTTTVSFPAVSVVSLEEEVVAYYRFEEGAIGQSATAAADSTPVDDPLAAGAASGTFSADVPLALVPATSAENEVSVDFGAADVRSLVASSSGELAGTAFRSFTIEAFAKFTGTTGVSTVVGRDDSGNPGQVAGSSALFYLQRNGTALRCVVINSNGAELVAASPAAAVANKWYHLAAVGDAVAGTLSLYVDGQLAATTSGFTELFVPTSG